MTDTPWLQRLVRLFVLPGIFFGILTGLQNSSLASGIAAGLIFAALFGALMSLIIAMRTRRLGGLQRADRQRVMTFVQKGQPITDPRLAPAVLDYAAVVRRAQGKPTTLRRMTAGFIVLAIVILVVAIAAGHPTAIAADVVVLGLWINNSYRLPKRRELILERVDRAENEARQLLGASGAATDADGRSNGPNAHGLHGI